jgi:predicted SAM-dependent methyltransferase
MNDKIKKINGSNTTILELGCGSRKIYPNAVGLDILDSEEVDLCGDVYDILKKIDDNVIELIYSHHFIEHVNNLSLLLNESARVLKRGGKFKAVVPHFSNPYFYSDYTHKNFFGLYTLQYFCSKKYFHRRVPNYNSKLNFEIEGIKILFGADKPFYLKYAIGKVLNKIVNISTLTKEYYETNLTKIIPCTELEITLIKI